MQEELFDEGFYDEGFYTMAEVAQVLRVSVPTVWRWVHSGQLPAYRVGQRQIRIRKSDLGSVISRVRAKPAPGILKDEADRRAATRPVEETSEPAREPAASSTAEGESAGPSQPGPASSKAQTSETANPKVPPATPSSKAPEEDSTLRRSQTERPPGGPGDGREA